MEFVNPIREALAGGRFSYMVELVASGMASEAKILNAAAQLAQIPEIVGAGITNYAGGVVGHDPIRVGLAARARGLAPNIHLTCVNRDVESIQHTLEDLQALGVENVFAITGDYPKGAKGKVEFAGDSVQLVEMIDRMRQKSGFPFQISVAVSPFKYTEADCAYQYLKLEKKIAAGADYAITQLGFDARKFRELRRYMDEHGLATPVFGNVYILNARAAGKMSKGDPPGCWVSQELVERIQQETQSVDKGLAARLERAAKMVAILRGLKYAGAYIGGDHKAAHIRWVIRRSEELASRWEEFAEEISYAPRRGFYFHDLTPSLTKRRRVLARVMDAAGKLLPVNKDTRLRGILTSVFRQIDRIPRAASALERLEFAVKSPTFGCQACGNCVLGLMEYVCPMTCPKNLRNGPCGGTNNGQCEVIPTQTCIWVAVYDRAKAAGRVEDLLTHIPPRDPALQGTSSWINYFLNRDSRPSDRTALIQIEGSGQIVRKEAINVEPSGKTLV